MGKNKAKRRRGVPVNLASFVKDSRLDFHILGQALHISSHLIQPTASEICDYLNRTTDSRYSETEILHHLRTFSLPEGKVGRVLNNGEERWYMATY